MSNSWAGAKFRGKERGSQMFHYTIQSYKYQQGTVRTIKKATRRRRRAESKNAGVTQLEEYLLRNQDAGGSSPLTGPTTPIA